MSADASIEFAWADGIHRFRLGLGEISELQEKINKPRIAMGGEPIGPWTLMQLAREGNLWPHETREVIRLGLIGGGKNPLDALALVLRYVDARPALENLPFVVLILMAAVSGVEGDEVGKKTEAETTKTEPEVTDSSSPQSTVQAQQSDGQSVKSTKHRSGNSQQPLTDGMPHTAPANNS